MLSPWYGFLWMIWKTVFYLTCMFSSSCFNNNNNKKNCHRLCSFYLEDIKCQNIQTFNYQVNALSFRHFSKKTIHRNCTCSIQAVHSVHQNNILKTKSFRDINRNRHNTSVFPSHFESLGSFHRQTSVYQRLWLSRLVGGSFVDSLSFQIHDVGQ